MGSLVEVRLGADDALAWLVRKPQAELAVDLCHVGRVRVCENGQDVAERGDDGCDLASWRRSSSSPAGSISARWRRYSSGFMLPMCRASSAGCGLVAPVVLLANAFLRSLKGPVIVWAAVLPALLVTDDALEILCPVRAPRTA
jgi:hypothetical protein